MPEPDVFEVLCSAIRKGVGNPNIAISRETSAADVPGWDSLAHTRIIMVAEVALNVDVDLEATYRAATVGELAQLLSAALAKK